ncbi:unnamed protein product [Adineta steineri]|uniref:Transposase n=1 Tax=Adineta steineri TaxID=433720 RepID=A0A815ISG1_9BILA|nr:unnamed protein product [Adineta steineri]CAF3600416.1 unnamed protein product [Adineta steineri]
MAGTYDSEQQRIFDRIKCIAFREARDDSATFITRQWIVGKISRNASQDLIRDATGKQKRSSYALVKGIATKHKEHVTSKTIDNYRHREGLKPFHVIPKPLKTETHISNRLWLCDWLRDWAQEDLFHLAPSDEFYVWTIRRPNYQNDRVWARSTEDIEDNQRYREMVTFVHDKAPCMRANMTQHLLKDNDITFWGNDIWPDNSPDLNAAVHIGTKIKDEVERKLLSETDENRLKQETLEKHLVDVLTNMESNVELFENLLCSYPSRLQAVRNANRRHTDY